LQLQPFLSAQVDEDKRLFTCTLVRDELTRFMHGQYREVSNALHYHTTRQQPEDLEAYLIQSRDGVGLRALAAMSLACEAQSTTRQDWERWLPVVRVGSQIIRLVNDGGTFLREQAEEKPTSITIALASLGYPLASYTLESPEVLQALHVVHKRLEEDRMHFHRLTSHLLQEAPLTPLAYCLISAITSISRLYQAGGDYEVPRDDN
jgi:hypothetical protein